MGMHRKMVLNLFSKDQFGNNMFHSQRGTQNKTVLNVKLWNKLFHLQIGTRNKTVLNVQYYGTMCSIYR